MAATNRRRVHVILPDAILQEVDAQVGPRGRSEFIQEAVEEKLNCLRRVAAFSRIAGSIVDGEIPEWATPESTAAWIREIRKDRTIDHVPESTTA